MDRLLDDFTRAASDLKVHNRTAANIREQLLIITRSYEGANANSQKLLCPSLKIATEKLQSASRLPPLQSYLRQGEISDTLDSLLEDCWKYAQRSDDDFLREDIEVQREIYKSDDEADRVNVKRLLRDSLRRNDVLQQLSKLTPHETAALHSAISLELRSLADQGPDSLAACLYRDVISRLELGSNQNQTPTSVQDLTGKIGRISKDPVAWGAVCAVWKGELYGKQVSLQGPPLYTQQTSGCSEDTVLKNAMIWASFTHPHVVPLLGFCKDLDRNRLLLVSPWMENQSVEYFIRINPGADRLKLITEIAAGLAYLHTRSPPYVHGFLSGTAVLVNEDGQTMIGGFASATFMKGLTCPLRWLAPEVVKHDVSALSMASDVYSFAMTALQIMTGEVPFHQIRSPTRIVDMIERGERPSRPDRKLVHHGLDDRLWSLISRCWVQDLTARPPMNEVLRELERMRELPALDVRDLTGLLILGDGSLTDVRACGAFGDIRVGILKGIGPVALKTLNIKGSTQPVLRHTKRFFREASIWNELKHPNVLPFLGTADPPGLSTCLISPWMENGNLFDFMRGHPDEPLLPIARGINRGLAYLHAHKPHPVIHGDLRAANVLISSDGVPLLCDFGLAVIVEDLTQMPISSVMQDAGNPRWMAPELLIGEQQVSTSSDIWALGMVLLELMSHDIPYYELKSSPQVIVAVHKGLIPSRPSGEDAVDRGLTDELWDLMKRCWARKPDDRPSAADTLRAIETLAPDGTE